jgi:hypothetical protein
MVGYMVGICGIDIIYGKDLSIFDIAESVSKLLLEARSNSYSNPALYYYDRGSISLPNCPSPLAVGH